MQLVIALAQLIPSAIEAIKKSQTLTDDEKKVALDTLESELEKIRAQVAAVKFRELADKVDD